MFIPVTLQYYYVNSAAQWKSQSLDSSVFIYKTKFCDQTMSHSAWVFQYLSHGQSKENGSVQSPWKDQRPCSYLRNSSPSTRYWLYFRQQEEIVKVWMTWLTSLRAIFSCGWNGEEVMGCSVFLYPSSQNMPLAIFWNEVISSGQIGLFSEEKSC